MPGTGKKFRKMCKRKGIQVHFKGTNTLRTMLGNPKDKDPKNNQTGIIYHYKCPQINCPSAYIGESGRSLGERVKEHFKAPSPIHLHRYHHRTSNGPWTVQHSPQRGQQPVQDHQGGHVYLGTGSNTQQEPREVPTTSHLGPPSNGITNPAVQAFQHSNYLPHT